MLVAAIAVGVSELRSYVDIRVGRAFHRRIFPSIVDDGVVAEPTAKPPAHLLVLGLVQAETVAEIPAEVAELKRWLGRNSDKFVDAVVIWTVILRHRTGPSRGRSAGRRALPVRGLHGETPRTRLCSAPGRRGRLGGPGRGHRPGHDSGASAAGHSAGHRQGGAAEPSPCAVWLRD